MAVSKDSGIATRTSDGDNSNLRQTFVVSFYHALFSGRGITTHIGNTKYECLHVIDYKLEGTMLP